VVFAAICAVSEAMSDGNNGIPMLQATSDGSNNVLGQLVDSNDQYSDIVPEQQLRDSLHFVPYKELTEYVKALAKSHFHIRIDSAGKTNVPGHYVTYRCWCCEQPININ
jgi:hypothetical protein